MFQQFKLVLQHFYRQFQHFYRQFHNSSWCSSSPNRFSSTPLHHVKSQQFGSHLLSSLNPAKTSLWTSYQPISLVCQAAKVMEALMLTTVNIHVLPAFDQHGFQPGHSTTFALLQLMSDVATCFNQRKLSHRTICVAVDLMTAFNTVNHNILLSKITRPMLPEATCRWLTNYIRGRQSVKSCRGIKSKARLEVVTHDIQFLHKNYVIVVTVIHCAQSYVVYFTCNTLCSKYKTHYLLFWCYFNN